MDESKDAPDTDLSPPDICMLLLRMSFRIVLAGSRENWRLNISCLVENGTPVGPDVALWEAVPYQADRQASRWNTVNVCLKYQLEN
jgi:hypothetical protein